MLVYSPWSAGPSDENNSFVASILCDDVGDDDNEGYVEEEVVDDVSDPILPLLLKCSFL